MKSKTNNDVGKVSHFLSDDSDSVWTAGQQVRSGESIMVDPLCRIVAVCLRDSDQRCSSARQKRN